MSQILGSLTIKSGVATSFTSQSGGIKGIVISNESGFTCDINMGTSAINKRLLPGTADFFRVITGFNGVIIIKPSTILSTAFHYPASQLTFEAVGIYESVDESQYPIALTRPMVAGIGSSQNGFSTAIVLTVAGANGYSLNMFNPANSGVVAAIYAAQIKHNGATAVTCNLFQRTDGIDNNFPIGAIIFQHNIIALPSSQMHLTAQNNTAIVAPNAAVGTWIIDSDLFDFLGSPDSLYLNPGQNIMLNVQNPVNPSLVFMMFKWTEQ